MRYEYDMEKGTTVELPDLPPPEPVMPGEDDHKNAIVAMLDAKAQERRYDNAVSIATYENSTEAPWAAEAAAFIAWRDQVWKYAYAELEKVMTGQRTQPTVAEFLNELPAMEWPL